MTKGIGRAVDVGIAKESVRGTAVVPVFWIPQMSLTMEDKIEQSVDESSVGVIEDAIDGAVTEKYAEGTLEARLQAESFGLFLLNTIGAVNSAVKGGETLVYEHTFSILQSAQHPSLTFSVTDPQGDKSYPLGMINSLELAVALNEYASFSADIRSKAGESASLTPSYIADDEAKIFLPQHGEFKVADNLAGLGAASPVCIRNVTLTIEKNLEDDLCIGSVAPSDILNKQFSVSGSVEIMYDSSAFNGYLLNDTAKAMRIKLANTAITIGSASNPTLQIDLAKVKFSEVTQPYSNNDLIVQTISFKGFYSLDEAKLLDIILTNETASY